MSLFVRPSMQLQRPHLSRKPSRASVRVVAALPSPLQGTVSLITKTALAAAASLVLASAAGATPACTFTYDGTPNPKSSETANPNQCHVHVNDYVRWKHAAPGFTDGVFWQASPNPGNVTDIGENGTQIQMIAVVGGSSPYTFANKTGAGAVTGVVYVAPLFELSTSAVEREAIKLIAPLLAALVLFATVKSNEK